MDNVALKKGAKRLKAISCLVAFLLIIINIAGCSSTPITPASMPPPMPPYGDTLTPAPALTIFSISQSPAQNRARTITLKGSGFDNGAIVEIYSASGKYIGSGILSGKANSNQLTVKLSDLNPGKYTVKVKTTDGRFSNATTLTIPKPVQRPQCTGNLSKRPTVLYLGGGDAEKLFERYVTQNSVVEKIPYSLKIKFYEKDKEKKDFILQAIELGDLEQVFGVESPKDFLEKIKKLLKGRVAEFSETLADDASKENADYFQCPQ